MRQYNYLQAFYRSFYCRALYRDVVNNWGAGVVLYLLMVLAICWAVGMIEIQKTVDRGYEKLAQEYVPQMPHLLIENGVATTPENHPYLIRNPENDKVTIIVDTSGQYLNIDQAKSEVLVTKHEVMIKDSENQVRIEKFPKSLNLDLVPAHAKDVLEGYVEYSWLFLFPLLLFLSFVYRLVQAVLYAVLGKIVSSLSGVNLNYLSNLKLSMVAITPAIVVATILSLFNVIIPLQLLLYFALAVGYLIFAVLANKNK